MRCGAARCTRLRRPSWMPASGRPWLRAPCLTGTPFLFVDRVVSFDPEGRTLLAERHIDRDDPIFRGHFPAAPVFPAALQIEAIGQACLCLWSLAENGGRPTHLGLRVTRVEQAQFLSPVLPDQTMLLHAKLLAADELLVTAAGQVFVGDRLCAVLVINVAIVDG